jgi:putative ABC transport system substrate-binding protein
MLRPLANLVLASAILWPPCVAAQQERLPTVGFLTSGSVASLNKRWIAAFKRGLHEASYIDGQNIRIEYRAADDQYSRLEGLAGDLVSRKVSVIVAAGGPVSALAARKVTDTVPIVFTTIADPVKSGLVASINRPGGNVTGTAGLTSELDAKRLEILHELVSDAKTIGALINPNRPGVEVQSNELEASGRTIGLKLIFEKASTEQGINSALEAFRQQRVDGLLVTADPLFNFHRAQVIALAARFGLPAIYQWREFVEDGGLVSYGPSIADAYHQAGVYAAQILKGAKPADLPVMQPTRFEFVINLKTAKAQGLAIPHAFLARAEAVIE